MIVHIASAPLPVIPALGDVLAHGVGERADLPVPFSLALAGAVIALVISFVVLAYAWATPRFENPDAGRLLPAGVTRFADSPGFRIALQALGLLGTAYVGFAALFGPDLLVNPTFGAVYVLFWIGLVPLSVLFGPVWRYLNPLRTVHRLLTRALRLPADRGLLPLPARLGWWPAAVGLFAFVWLELVAPGKTTLPTVRLWFAVYAFVQLFAALLYGSRWFDKGDTFEAYSTLFGRLSPLGRRRSDRRLVLRNPLSGLATLAPAPGLLAIVAVMLGSTAFDGFSMGPAWIAFLQGGSVDPTLASSAALLGFVLVVALTFWLATTAAGGLSGVREKNLPARFAPSVIPIALGYVVAHYLTLLVLEGQRTLILLSDPLSNGWNLLGLSGHTVATGLAQAPAVVAAIKVSAVVLGHVLGIVAAHDRAVALFPRRTAVLGQLPLLLVMVGYTLGGLTLLFAT